MGQKIQKKTPPMMTPQPKMTKPPLAVPTAKTVFCYKQAVGKENTYETYIYDEITKYGDFDWETWSYEDSETSANHIREILQELPDGASLEIHINSNGGEAFEAVTVYNLLNQYKGHKTSYVDGVAHSAAFIIPFACDHRIMGQGTASLFHNMWSFAQGNASQLRMAADRLDKLMESNRKIYLERAVGLTEDEIKTMMENETMLTPEDCLKYGFCDEIAGYVKNVDSQIEGAQQRVQQLQQLASMQKEMQNQMLMLSQYAEEEQESEDPETQEENDQQEAEEQNLEETEQPTTEQKTDGQVQQNNVQGKALQFMSAFLNATTRL